MRNTLLVFHCPLAALADNVRLGCTWIMVHGCSEREEQPTIQHQLQFIFIYPSGTKCKNRSMLMEKKKQKLTAFTFTAKGTQTRM